MEIGIDCIEISRFDNNVISNENFLHKIFTKNEIQYCRKKANPSQHFAVRFAGKEAIVKALSCYNIKIPQNKIEILKDRKGIPSISILSGECKNFEIKISISHSKEIAMAAVIISKQNDELKDL